MTRPDWWTKMMSLPEGYSRGRFAGKIYGLSLSTFNDGSSHKFYAEELGGTDFVSLNLYETTSGLQLKPCEMPAEKVIDFLLKVELIPE